MLVLCRPFRLLKQLLDQLELNLEGQGLLLLLLLLRLRLRLLLLRRQRGRRRRRRQLLLLPLLLRWQQLLPPLLLPLLLRRLQLLLLLLLLLQGSKHCRDLLGRRSLLRRWQAGLRRLCRCPGQRRDEQLWHWHRRLQRQLRTGLRQYPGNHLACGGLLSLHLSAQLSMDLASF